MSRTFILICVLINILPFSAAFSAEIHTKGEGACPIELSGEIVVGDLQRLEMAVAATKIDEYDSNSISGAEHSVCLNSPGGSYVEGQLIAKLIHSKALGTRVLSGSRCYSACAFIFMAGRIKGDEDDGAYRYLSTGGLLGFHAPYLSLTDDKTYTSKDLNRISRLTTLIIADLITYSSFRSASSYQNSIDSSLLEIILSTSENDLFIIDSIEKAARWNISLFDISKSRPKLVLNYRQACVNFEHWVDNTPSEIADTYPPLRVVRLGGKKKKEYVRVDTGGLVDRYCVIEKDEGNDYMTICEINEFNGVNYGACPDYGIVVPNYYSRSPSTPITELR